MALFDNAYVVRCVTMNIAGFQSQLTYDVHIKHSWTKIWDFTTLKCFRITILTPMNVFCIYVCIKFRYLIASEISYISDRRLTEESLEVLNLNYDLFPRVVLSVGVQRVVLEISFTKFLIENRTHPFGRRLILKMWWNEVFCLKRCGASA